MVVLALLGVEVPLNMGVEIKDERSITRYLVWGSLAVMLAYLLATWAVMVTVPAADGQSAQVTALATAVGAALTGWLAKLVAILFAAFFLFITVVYNFSFARLVFVSGLDQKLPAAMAKVNKHKVPSNAVWVQTIIAALFALVAFIVLPSLGVGGGEADRHPDQGVRRASGRGDSDLVHLDGGAVRRRGDHHPAFPAALPRRPGSRTRPSSTRARSSVACPHLSP